MSLRVEALAVYFGDVAIIKPQIFDVSAGEIVTVMGPSGSGKTTLLSAIAGDLPPALLSTGEVFLNGRSLHGVAVESRRIGRLFQDDLLFPHLTVGENLMFGMARGHRAEREAMMRTALQRLELEGFEHRAPHTLSGGQRSRVALMRSLLPKPVAMLLDEPFSKLDRGLRDTIRNYTYSHLRLRNIPTLIVTHDPEDIPEGGRVIYV
jgi:putative thiamine transport system ATP-binding protein